MQDNGIQPSISTSYVWVLYVNWKSNNPLMYSIPQSITLLLAATTPTVLQYNTVVFSRKFQWKLLASKPDVTSPCLYDYSEKTQY